jgi:hypothetical protein
MSRIAALPFSRVWLVGIVRAAEFLFLKDLPALCYRAPESTSTRVYGPLGITAIEAFGPSFFIAC